MASFGATREDLLRYKTLILSGIMSAPPTTDYFVVDGDLYYWSAGNWVQKPDVSNEVGGKVPLLATPDQATAFQSLVSVDGVLTRIMGGDTTVASGEYALAYRGSQGDNSYLKDISGKFGDATLNPVLFPAAWAAATVYAVGNYRSPATPNGWLYKVTTAGSAATAGAEPTWPTTAGATVTDASGNVWTCEKGPWYVHAATGRRQFRSISSAQLGAAGAGSCSLPMLTWDMAAGDSLIVNVSGAHEMAGQGNDRIILSTRSSAAGNKGFSLSAGESYKDYRLTITDGTTNIVTGHTLANFGANPMDGAFHSTTIMIDGQTKRLYMFHDGAPYLQSDMYDAGTPVPYDMSLATITGSTQSTVKLCLGGRHTSAGALETTAVSEIGMQSLDVLSLRGRGLPTDMLRIAQWFHQRGAQPLPAALTV